MKYVYLAGPILGCTKGEANDWRQYVDGKLMPGVCAISPLRCEPIIGERYTNGYADDKFGTARAIGSKNMFDTSNCDMVLAYLPEKPEGALADWHQSYGTIAEMGWAHALRKPIILVSRDLSVTQHPVLNYCANWVLSELDDAIEVVNGILGGYEGGKNV